MDGWMDGWAHAGGCARERCHVRGFGTISNETNMDHMPYFRSYSVKTPVCPSVFTLMRVRATVQHMQCK